MMFEVRVVTAGKCYRRLQYFTCLGGLLTETPEMSVEIVRRTCPCSMRIRRHLREVCDQAKVMLSLTIRMVKAEKTEALVYG